MEKTIKIGEIFMFYHLNHGNCGKLLYYHSYECQRIHTKNQFDEILNFNSNL